MAKIHEWLGPTQVLGPRERQMLIEAEDFPNAAYDDLTDTFTQVTVYARDAGLIASPAVEEEDDENDEPKERRQDNPYSR